VSEQVNGVSETENLSKSWLWDVNELTQCSDREPKKDTRSTHAERLAPIYRQRRNIQDINAFALSQ
jgi:hypothetical protein